MEPVGQAGELRPLVGSGSLGSVIRHESAVRESAAKLPLSFDLRFRCRRLPSLFEQISGSASSLPRCTGCGSRRW